MPKCLRVLALAVVTAAFAPFCSAAEIGGPDTCRAAAVTISETTKTIPTYDYEQGLRMAMPHDWLASYPYPDLKFYELPSKPTPKTYRAIVMENDYLKMTMLPDLGCRIIQLIYKSTGQSVFYENQVMKPYHMCEQGWWMATGGMEFCFPITEHSTNILKPWLYLVQKHPDGSATITVSDTHQRTGLTESVAITLRPDSCALGFHIRLTNPQSTAKPFMFWINPMLPANDQVEIIIPTTEMIDFGKKITTWPVNDCVDVSRLANWKVDNSIFANKLRSGFSGMYDHSRNLGLVRTFPFPQAGGAKIFSYGHTERPDLQPKMYTDSEDRYFEPWGGYARTFWDTTTLKAHGVVEWSENWYPVSATDGFKAASADVAVNAAIKHERIALTIFPSRDIKSAKIVLGSGGAVLGVWRENLRCGRLLTMSAPLFSHTEPAYVTVYEGNRKLLSDLVEWPKPVYKKLPPPKVEESNDDSPPPPPPKKAPEKPLSFTQLYAKDRISDAVKLYESTGVPKNGGSMEYGLALMRRGRYDDAASQFAAIKSNPAAAYSAGVLALRKNDVAGARWMFALSAQQNPKDAGALIALGITWASEDKAKAQSYFSQALVLDTNNLLALTELADLQDAQARSRIDAALSYDPQNAVYLALGYLDLSALPKAELYAEKAVDADPNNVTAYAVLIDSRVRAGKAEAADEALNKLRQVDVEKSEVYGGDDAVIALEEAARARPNDSRLMIHLATAYQERDNVDAAVDMAKRAAEAEPTIARAYFIQAQAIYERNDQRDLQVARQAARYIDKCLSLKPTVASYYTWADPIYNSAGRWYASTPMMRQLNELDPKCDVPFGPLGWSAMWDDNDYPTAIKWFNLVSKSPLDHGSAGAFRWIYTKWMEKLLDTGQYAKLAEVYQKAPKPLNTDAVESLYAYARAAQALGKEAEARTFLEEMKARKEDLLKHGWAREWYYLGCALGDLGDKDTAHTLWTKCKDQITPWLKEDSHWQNGFYLMACTQDKLGQQQEALKTINGMWKSRQQSDDVKALYERITEALKAKSAEAPKTSADKH